MRNVLPLMLLMMLTTPALVALPSAVRADEPAPETCPVGPASPELAALIGTWALDTVDGKDPGQAMAVQFLDPNKALIYVGAAAEPVVASFGVNCCGQLVLSPVEAGALAPIVAAFEANEQSLTLFAPDGDWVFARVQTTTQNH